MGVGLFILAAVSRLPFQEKILYHWDSINFALSLQHFDVAAGQPHIPGYILYVLLARLVNAVVGDAQLTLVGISLVSSGLAVACLYVLGSTMFNRATGLTAALFLASSPLFWFYGEVALPHSLDALVVIVTVWLLYRIMQGEAALAVPAAIWIAVAGGLRPQTQLFLMPLALVAGWRLGWKRGLLALGVMAVVDFAWAIPLVWSTGGLARYLQVTREFTAAFNTTTSVFSGGGLWGLQRNVHKLAMYTLYGWGLAVIPAVVAGLKVLRSLSARRLAIAKGLTPRSWSVERSGGQTHKEQFSITQAVGQRASALSGAVSTAVMRGCAILGDAALARAGARLLRFHSHGATGVGVCLSAGAVAAQRRCALPGLDTNALPTFARRGFGDGQRRHLCGCADVPAGRGSGQAAHG